MTQLTEPRLFDQIIGQARADAGAPRVRPRCPQCNSRNLYSRLRTKDRVCRKCGHQFPIEQRAPVPDSPL